MGHRATIALAALAAPMLAIATSSDQTKLDVCRVAATPEKWFGKTVRVKGYIVDLNSHGFVLTSARGCKGDGQLELLTKLIEQAPIWRKAFVENMGPKRAVLVGRIRWTQARMGGRNLSLDVERIERITPYETRWDELSQATTKRPDSIFPNS